MKSSADTDVQIVELQAAACKHTSQITRPRATAEAEERHVPYKVEVRQDSIALHALYALGASERVRESAKKDGGFS